MMTLSLEPVSPDGCELARGWRNAVPESLRTPFPLTIDQQKEFYQSLQDRKSPHRYWMVWAHPYVGHGMIGMVGLTNIDWYNGLAEISIVISPNEKGKGYGKEAVHLVLKEAFENMRLHQVVGECYDCNPISPFWEKVVEKYGGSSVRLPDRKWYAGKYWGAIYFSISEDGWKALSLDHAVAGSDNRGDKPSCTAA